MSTAVAHTRPTATQQRAALLRATVAAAPARPTAALPGTAAPPVAP